MNQITEFLQDKYKVNDLGEVNHFLGMIIERDRVAGTTHIHQELLVKSILEKFKGDLEHERAWESPADEKTYSYHVEAVFRGDERTLVELSRSHWILAICIHMYSSRYCKHCQVSHWFCDQLD
jgi:hypothetical protein